MTASTYLIWNVDRIYRRWGVWLAARLERKTVLNQEIDEKLKGHVILFGHNRIGRVLLPVLQDLGQVVVVDFNPEVVERLEKGKVQAIYGDMADHELYERINMPQSELVISTVPDVNDGLQLLSEIRSWKQKPTVVLTASDSETAERLYKKGADYVLVPHTLGGHWLAQVLRRQGMEREVFHKFAGERVNEIGGK
jgi:voltage-gated potassium channel